LAPWWGILLVTVPPKSTEQMTEGNENPSFDFGGLKLEKRVSDIFFVWSPGGGQWKQKHTSYDSAQTEAERLAKVNPGQEFFVLGALGSAKIEIISHRIFKEFLIETPMPF
jgi:hypothetical protein